MSGLVLLRFAPVSPLYIAERILHMVAQVSSIENRIIVVEDDRVRVKPLSF